MKIVEIRVHVSNIDVAYDTALRVISDTCGSGYHRGFLALSEAALSANTLEEIVVPVDETDALGQRLALRDLALLGMCAVKRELMRRQLEKAEADARHEEIPADGWAGPP